MCLDVARDAMQMNASGRSLVQIQSDVDAKYGPLYPTRTPTAPAAANR